MARIVGLFHGPLSLERQPPYSEQQQFPPRKFGKLLQIFTYFHQFICQSIGYRDQNRDRDIHGLDWVQFS